MKQKMKRLLAGFLALLTAFVALPGSREPASAASPSANIAFWYASVKDSGEVTELRPGFDNGKILYSILDGNAAYCMNFGLSADAGQLMGSSPTPDNAMSAGQEKLLGYCLYYGFNSNTAAAPSSDQCDQYIATQAMVWVIMGNLFGTGPGDSAAWKLCDTAPDPQASWEYYLSLKSNISNSYYAIRPGFASRTRSGAETYELEWNEGNRRFEKTLSDSNGVLGNFDISLSGYTVEKDGNNVTISRRDADTSVTTAAMKSTTGAVETTTGCVFWLTGKAGYQEFVSERPNADPVYAYFKVKTQDTGYGEIVKTDESSGVRLAGAVYGIYSDSGCTALLQTMTTDPNGYAKSGTLTAGTYYVREITAPGGYVLDSRVYTLAVRAGQTTGISASDREQFGAITIYKEGEALAGWNGSSFTYEKRKLPGAVFKVTAGEDIYQADGTKAYSRGDLVAENLTGGSDGQVTLTGLHLGTYVVTETKSVGGYALNTTPQTVKIEYKDQRVEVQQGAATVLNARQKAEVSVTKKDSVTANPLDGGQYTLYAGNDIRNYAGQVIVAKGDALQTVTTGEDGSAAYTADLPVANSYYISETQAPYAYYRDSSDVYSFTFSCLPETAAKATFSHTFTNDRATAKIHISKVDRETGKAVPQGDATLEGAVYGLYARSDIAHPDGVTGIMFHAGELVAALTTDGGGNAEISGLYLGNYYLKEITPPEGYLPDTGEYDVACSYEGDLVAEVSRGTTLADQVIRQPFQLIKVSDNGEGTEAPVLSGAGFKAYLKSSLSVLEDGSYDFGSAEPVGIGSRGETILFTDEKGHIVTQPIPYGTYVVVEAVTPHNMQPVRPFEVKVVKDSPAQPQVWRVFIDREFTAKLRVVKKDAGTGKAVLIPGTEFKIFNTDRNEYVKMTTTYPSKVTHTSFFTDGEGSLILPEALAIGRYRIEEVSAPYGYTLNTGYVEVSVDTDTFCETDPDTYDAIITVEYEDGPVTGELTLEKRGETLEDYRGGLFADSEEKEFIYREIPLAGATFEVYAAEDIFTADMQKDGNGNRRKYYSRGDLVATLTTGEDGKAKLSGIPLGQYRVVETEAPYGYVLNGEEQFVTFVYVDAKTPVIHESVTFTNDRQKPDMAVIKKDAEEGTPLAGAVFGLYAAGDIRNMEGEVIVEAGTLLETAVSDENGRASFKKDYPFAVYEAGELAAPKGYVSSGETITFEPEYQGQHEKTAEYSMEFLNTPTAFEFTKEDITSGAELSGALLAVLDKDGNVVDRWTSVAGEPHVVKRLTVGETYTLREEFAPYGYLKSADVLFTVEDTEEIQSIVMKDEAPTGTIIINKDGEFITDTRAVQGYWYDFIFDYFRDSLAGVTFELYAAEDIVSPDGLGTVYYEADKSVATLITDRKGFAVIDGLPPGKYYLVETRTLEGFVLDDTPVEADLSYIDQDTGVVYAGMNISNERQKVQITVAKKAAGTDEALGGAVFGLYAKEDIVNRDGRVVVKAGTETERGVTGKDGKLAFVSDLPLGKYYVRELEAPKGYVKSDTVSDVDASYQGDDKEIIEFEAEFENSPIRVQVSKTDITGSHELEGAVLSVIDADGSLVEKWTSGKEPHMLERLPAGTYTLREETAPFGYVTAQDIAFEVRETTEIQKVEMRDETAAGKIIISKKSENGKALAGAKFEIRNRDGEVIETLTTDGDGHAESGELPAAVFVGGKHEAAATYTVVEVEAPEGYLIDPTPREVAFEYTDGRTRVAEYTLEVTNRPSEPDHPQTGDSMDPWAFAGSGLAAAAIMLCIFLRKRKKDGGEA